MSNYIDYLKWRGDISFDMSPFCEVDAMILSELAYINMSGITPSEFKFSEADCEKICRRHVLTRDPGDDIEKNLYSLAEVVMNAPRFSGIKICGYRDETDVMAQKQFAAVTFLLGEGLYFIAFRGTDNSLIGWKENLDLSYNVQVPSQKAAVEYLNEAVKSLKGKFYVGGHSKGGNLAVYATAFSFKKTSKQVKAVYNFDGPGFNDAVTGEKGFHDIFDKVNTFVPQNSLIGLLLRHEEPYIVIHSTKTSGAGEHQLDTWEVGPLQIVRETDLGGMGKVLNENIQEWIDSMTYDDKKQFIDVVFSLVDDYSSVDDLFSAKNITAIMMAYRDLSDENKKKISTVMDSLSNTVTGNIKEFFQDKGAALVDRIKFWQKEI